MFIICLLIAFQSSESDVEDNDGEKKGKNKKRKSSTPTPTPPTSEAIPPKDIAGTYELRTVALGCVPISTSVERKQPSTDLIGFSDISGCTGPP